MRPVDQWCLPFARVQQARSRFRALRLGAQAAWMHQGVLDRIQNFALASKAIRGSATLRVLLKLVARLGSWINTTEPGVEAGFAVTSALPKLRQFRALRGDREISLLHVVVLGSVMLGQSLEGVDELGRQLARELDGVSVAAKEDLKQLHGSVTHFRSEADWLVSEAADPERAANYSAEARERFREIYRVDFAWRADALEEAWATTRSDWEGTVAFFGERRNDQVTFEQSAEKLLLTVEKFCREVQDVSREIASQPDRFALALPMMVPTGGNDGCAAPRVLTPRGPAGLGAPEEAAPIHLRAPPRLSPPVPLRP